MFKEDTTFVHIIFRVSSLIISIVILLQTMSCVPKHVVSINPPPIEARGADFSDVDLYLTKFKITNQSSSDNTGDVNSMRNKFLAYLEAQNRFKRVNEAGQFMSMPDNNRYLMLQVQIEPAYSIHRTWILDLPFFFPMSGYWPITPMWGTAKVNITAQFIGPDKKKIDISTYQEEEGYFIFFYSWYQTKPIEEALQICYEKVFKKVSKDISDKRNPVIAYVDGLPANYNTPKKGKLEFSRNNQTISIAVIELDAINIEESESVALSSRLLTEIFKTGYFNILEREKMEEILTEQGFQMSGCTSSECMVEAGKLLNVQQILGGSVSKIGGYYSVELRLIDVESGQILKVANEDIKGTIDDVFIRGLKQAVFKLVQ